jgi:hypothetical protein
MQNYTGQTHYNFAFPALVREQTCLSSTLRVLYLRRISSAPLPASQANSSKPVKNSYRCISVCLRCRQKLVQYVAYSTLRVLLSQVCSLTRAWGSQN